MLPTLDDDDDVNDDVNEHVFAAVSWLNSWLKLHPAKSFYGKPVELWWKDLFDNEMDTAYMPVH